MSTPPPYEPPTPPPYQPPAQPSGVPQYGAAPSYPQPSPAGPAPVVSIVGMSLGIVSVLASLVPLIGLLIALGAVITSFIGRRKEPAAKGFWLTGIITGFVALAITLVVVAIWVVIVGFAIARGSSADFSN